MKITKFFILFALASMMAVSCKETKKEDVVDEDVVVDMTDEGADGAYSEGSDDATVSANDGAESTASSSLNKAAGIESETMGVEELDVPEGVISEELAETPVVYPGCDGTAEEIRACNKKSYINFLMSEFDKDIAKEANIPSGEYRINTLFHVDEKGNVKVLRVSSPSEALEIEMKRVAAKVPQLVPATKGGEPVGVTFILPIDYKVE